MCITALYGFDRCLALSDEADFVCRRWLFSGYCHVHPATGDKTTPRCQVCLDGFLMPLVSWSAFRLSMD